MIEWITLVRCRPFYGTAPTAHDWLDALEAAFDLPVTVVGRGPTRNDYSPLTPLRKTDAPVV